MLGPVFRALPISEAVERALGYRVEYYREAIEHPSLDRPYWQARDHSATVPLVTAPVNLIGGWHDIFLRETLADYAALAGAGRAPHLTIGPWTHTDGEVMVTSLREGLRWFAAHLQGDQAALRARPVRLYVMGGGGWRDLDAWPPPARPTRLYLHAGGRLAADPPAVDAPADHYRYDPADPTPNIGGPLIFPPAGAQDQRPLEARPDVLCYTTDPLPADLEIIGPVRLELYVYSSRAHTDLFGRLCDVAPNGRSVNICEGLTRLEPAAARHNPTAACASPWTSTPPRSASAAATASACTSPAAATHAGRATSAPASRSPPARRWPPPPRPSTTTPPTPPPSCCPSQRATE